jgi:phytoene dehydrogenase-like protein
VWRLPSSTGWPNGKTPDQYREFSAQCYRLAAEAKTEELEKILREMARAWGEVAEELET